MAIFLPLIYSSTIQELYVIHYYCKKAIACNTNKLLVQALKQISLSKYVTYILLCSPNLQISKRKKFASERYVPRHINFDTNCTVSKYFLQIIGECMFTKLQQFTSLHHRYTQHCMPVYPTVNCLV